MSYILDALRRADADRRRGQAPVLGDVVGEPGGSALLAAPAARRSPWARRAPWLAVAFAGVAALLLAGWWFRTPTPAPVMAVAPPNPAPAMAPRPPAAAAPLPPAPVVRMPEPAPAKAPPSAPAVAPANRGAAVAPLVAPVPATVPAPGPAPAPVPAPAPAPSPPPATAPPPPRPVPASTLPEPQRSAVARLAFGGAVHSAERRQSFVLLAGQIVREGETLAAGIVLERITPRALLLRVGDQLVELPL